MSPKAQPGKEQNSESQAQICESPETTAEYSTPRKEYMKLTAVFVEIPGGYMGYVEELPGANTEGATLPETRENLMEAIQLTLEANRELTEETIAELSLKGQHVIREQLVLAAA